MGYIPIQINTGCPIQRKSISDHERKWTPAFMSGPKGDLHKAQGLGSVSYPGQADTNIYFAGNNTVADSEEGALVSAISMAEYAFHVKNPITGFNPLAWFIHHTYRNVMFPGFTAKKLMISCAKFMPKLRRFCTIWIHGRESISRNIPHKA
jgi:hypothetical protein